MKTLLSMFAGVVLLGAVSSASADDFAQERADAHSFWDQQVQCVDTSDWSGTATCLSTLFQSYF
ncbi:hypothetical protein VC273_09750 [Xanthomonas nasturtii]|uniref:hypothetical protein n=1 Tax=Xanthomonas TaxID=338 RepID=UPI000E1F6BFB|nr:MULTISPECIES: hypothetical protein [Xanthomonas]MEA9556190.1 hypothetical protein [Xanthomonas nasturtii]MEA9562951.1 hypothetical protein [Xanthomonas sp. WHRI 8932A]MEA9587817.1 hypothetical protein [Xanthomonas sp. WHRI 10064B]MEA9615539.1 hypothetical protein [Xanthomonas sp. WHRI 10064A]MEA9634004.1 hypothetical protein [Xanthomonas sp. WHRI 8812E]